MKKFILLLVLAKIFLTPALCLANTAHGCPDHTCEKDFPGCPADDMPSTLED